MEFFHRSPRLLGHRGSGANNVSNLAIENTAESCLLAVEHGANGVEIDVQLSADGKFVVHHADRTPNGILIRELTFPQLQKLIPHIETLPILLSQLSTHPQADSIGIDLEIKTGYSRNEPIDNRLASVVADYLPTLAQQWPLLVTSFDPTAINTIAKRINAGEVPTIPLGLLVASTDVQDHQTPIDIETAVARAHAAGATVVAAQSKLLGLETADPQASQKATDSVNYVHSAGMKLLVWCPEPNDAAIALAAGVDAVCVNHVAETAQLNTHLKSF